MGERWPYETVKERHKKSCDVRLCAEQLHRNQRVLGYARLAIHKREDHKSADDEQCDDFCRVPCENCSAEVEAKQNHERESKESEDTPPIDGFDTVQERRVGVLDVEEEEDEAEGEAADREIDVDFVVQ